jgi:hypothetical protein
MLFPGLSRESALIIYLSCPALATFQKIGASSKCSFCPIWETFSCIQTSACSIQRQKLYFFSNETETALGKENDEFNDKCRAEATGSTSKE